MKKINRKITAITFVLLTTLFTECKDSFLEKTNTFQGGALGLSSTKEGVVSLVNGVYDTYQNSDLLKKCIWYRANFSTHDFFNWGGDVFWNNYQIPSTFGGLSTLWNQSYLGLARANSSFTAISIAQKNNVISAKLANRLRGEALFLRGMTYYYLGASFGGVPLEIDTIGSTNLGLRPRSSQDSVFQQVVSDMQAAEKLLFSKKDLSVSDLGRATKGAAYAYEGAARMFLADYTGALAAFNNIELTSNYTLLPNFIDVHEYNNQNNDESIFEVQFELKAGDPQDWGGSWNPPGGEIAWIDSFSWPAEITQQGYDYGNPALSLSYQAGDLRKLATIVGPGDQLVSPSIIAKWGGVKGYIPVDQGYQAWTAALTSHPASLTPGDSANARKYVANHNNFTAMGTPVNTVGTVEYPWYGDGSGKTNGNRTGYFCSKKWRDPNLTGNYGNPAALFGDQNQILMRYAEVILSRAECKVRLGDIAGAMDDLTLVRDRAWGGAGLAPATMQDGANYDGSASQPITDPLQMVLSEYRHELAGEYSLFFLLRRAGTDVAIDFIKQAYGTVDGSYNPIPNPATGFPTADGQQHGLYNTSLTASKVVLPIPSIAISLNPNLTQNSGY